MSAVFVRYWYLLQVAIYALGFAAPWDRWLEFDRGQTAWLALAAWPARNRWLSFDGATIAVLLIGIAFAFAGAMLRTWGRRSAAPRLGCVGMVLHTIALAMLMPPSGAAFAIVATAVLQFAIADKTNKISLLAATWGRAVSLETYVWGVALSFAIAGWRYNAFLLTQCALVAFGVSLVARALSSQEQPAA